MNTPPKQKATKKEVDSAPLEPSFPIPENAFDVLTRPMPNLSRALADLPPGAQFMARILAFDVDAIELRLAKIRGREDPAWEWETFPETLRRYYKSVGEAHKDFSSVIGAGTIEKIGSSGRKKIDFQPIVSDLKQWAEEIGKTEMTEELRDRLRPVMDALHFLEYVYFPCMLVNDRFPETLYEKAAKEGTPLAIAKLLRLDKRVLSISPEIQEHFTRHMHGGNVEIRKAIASAMAADSFDRIKPELLRARIAALIRGFVEAEGETITYVALFEIFHAASRDRTGRKDVRLPETLPAFQMAVKREYDVLGGNKLIKKA